MKRLIFVSILGFIFLAFNVKTINDNQTTWERYFLLGQVGEDWAMTSCIAKDGNYLIAGYTKDLPNKSFVIKMTPDGDTLWARKFENSVVSTVAAFTICSTDDNGCIFGGFSDELNLVKIDADGNLVWNNIYSEVQHVLRSIKRTNNGDFVATGYKYPFTSLMIRIDLNGNLVWNRADPSFRDIGCFVETSDSGFIALASTPNPQIIKLNKSGTIEWSNNVPAGYGPAVINKIGENEYLITGLGDFIINENGDIITKFNIPFEPNELPTAFLYSSSTEEIRYMVRSTYKWLPQTVVSKIILYDLNGTILSEKLIVDSNNNSREIRGITQLYDGYLFTGIRNFDTATEQSIGKSMVIKTDSLLNFKPVGISNNGTNVADDYSLGIYPNPFNTSTKIKFNLPSRQYIEISVYDITGREIKRYDRMIYNSGTNELIFYGGNLSSGVYLLLFQSESELIYKKISLIK